MLKNSGTWIAVLVASAVLTGCSPETVSLHPVYNDQDLVMEEALAGEWQHRQGKNTETWRFEADVEGRKYRLFIGDDPQAIRCRLVRLSNYLFLDVEEPAGHTFLRVELTPDLVRLAGVDESWLKAKLNKENALPFERVRRDKETQLVIRASTADMQHFLLTYATDPAAFPEWEVLRR